MDNRLTKTYENGSYGVADDLPCGENSHDFKRLLVDKMGAYESLGTPAELESLQRERDAYYENAKYTEAAFHEVTKLRAEVESLQRERDKWKESYESEQTDKWDARSERDDIAEAYSNKVDECESLQRERDEYKKHANDFEEMYKQEHREKNAIQRDKAALIEELEWYGDETNHKRSLPVYDYRKYQSEVGKDKGERARTIISSMKGDTHE